MSKCMTYGCKVHGRARYNEYRQFLGYWCEPHKPTPTVEMSGEVKHEPQRHRGDDGAAERSVSDDAFGEGEGDGSVRGHLR